MQVQPEQVLQAFIAMNTKTDSVWSMYIVVHLGVLWFIFVGHRPLLAVERLMAFAGYTVFIFANARSLDDSYLMLQAMRLDIMGTLRTQFAVMPETFKSIVEVDYALRQQVIFVSHGVAWVVVLLVLGFRNRLIAQYHRAFPEHAAQAPAKE